jgi:hypothetical protein
LFARPERRRIGTLYALADPRTPAGGWCDLWLIFHIRPFRWDILLNHWIALMTEYAVYLDDSGHPDNQPYVVVAGFVAREEQWLAFESAWRSALKRNVLGSVFHMVEFESGPKTKAKGKILEDLTTTISSHVQGAFSVFVDMEAYRKVNETYTLEECLGEAVCARCTWCSQRN